MIIFPNNIDGDLKLQICKMLFEKDQQIELLQNHTKLLEDFNTKLLHKVELLEQYGKTHSILELDYPKDFGKGYELKDFPEGSFIKYEYFVIKQ